MHAKVPVLLYDRSSEQITKGLALVDKLLAKDVSKGRIQPGDAQDTRGRIQVVSPEEGLKGLRDVDMVVEVRVSSFWRLVGRSYVFGLVPPGCVRVAPTQTVDLRVVKCATSSGCHSCDEYIVDQHHKNRCIRRSGG